MLKVIRHIIQEMSTAPNLAAALQIVVSNITAELGVAAANIFILDEEKGNYALVASTMYAEIPEKAIIPYGRGLVSLVAERCQPVNLDDAQANPAFYSAAALFESDNHGYLGVPIVSAGEVIAVCSIYQKENEKFSSELVSFLTTLAILLSSEIEYAIAQGVIYDAFPKKRRRRKALVLSGTSGAPGVSIGTAKVVFPLADLDAVPEREAQDIDEEIKQFEKALQKAKADIKQLAEMAKERLNKSESVLFDAYLKILDSRSLKLEIKKHIQQGVWVQTALKQVIRHHVVQFESLDDDYLKERANDFKDLGRRILMHLQKDAAEFGKKKYPKKTILVGDELSASDLIEVPQGNLVGVVCANGSANSHVAILARAMGVPALMGVSGATVELLDDKDLIIDAYNDHLYVSPASSLKKEFRSLADEEQQLDAELESLRELPAETTDGHDVTLMVNTGLNVDPQLYTEVGAQGVGLYRSEMAFMVRETFPTEQDQYIIYKQLLNIFAPKPVVMRTLDVGGDKELDYFPIDEENPFLGWRGVRITLDQPDLFLQQIRAMLRAHVDHANLKIMLPMISSIKEVEDSQRLIHQALSELKEEGVEIKMPALGVMVETPASVYQAYDLAKRVDFLSIGTNDLIQYLLAIDRNNAKVSARYNAMHPAVIKAIKIVVTAGHKAGKRVSVCGEMAADPLCAVILLGLGVDMLSLNANLLPRIKLVIRTFSYERAKEIVSDVLLMDDATEIRLHLESIFEELGIAGLIRAGR